MRTDGVGALPGERPYDVHPSAQSRALGDDTEAEMARELTTGKAQAVTPEDFNARVKRLLADKPDPRKAETTRKNFKTTKPAPRV
jgi:hypothetical protein